MKKALNKWNNIDDHFRYIRCVEKIYYSMKNLH
jgi:hypothetical protein